MNTRHNRIIWLTILAFTLTAFLRVAAQDDDVEIVFATGRFFYDIAIIKSGEIVTITNENDKYTHLSTPQWSPDATRIAFTDGRNIYIVNVDGSDLVQLTAYDDPSSPRIVNISWSPDGKTIAATLYDENQNDSGYWIRLINIETSSEWDITTNEYSDGFWGISWSPSGDFIVFTSNRDGFVPAATGLYMLNIETGVVSPLTDISFRVRFDRYPTWSPDGLHIAFVSENYDDGRWDIYLIDVDGSNLQTLTNQANTPEIGVSNVRGTIDWSPDGNKIVFSACPNPYPDGCELFTIGIDGQNLMQITNDEEAGAFDPSWKPKPLDVSDSEDNSDEQ